MEEIRINEYYAMKFNSEQTTELPISGWELSIDNNYRKHITQDGKSIQEHLGLKSEILGFRNGDDLDFRPENLILAPVVEEVSEVVEPEVSEVEFFEDEEVVEEEPVVEAEEELEEE
jgi:hypothetical protein